MTDADVCDVTVTYRENKAQKLTVKTARYKGGYAYHDEFKFTMDGSTAVLKRIEPDGEEFMVQANSDTARLARNAVCDLPFVQGVVMFPRVEP